MKSFFAFISYKRGGIDEDVANWIHRKLEKYPYPANLVSPENRPQHDQFIRRVFIDTKELEVNENDFTDEIRKALQNSRYLIVVCSKLAAKSEYVNREVTFFLKTHNNDSRKILPVFIDTVENGLPDVLRNEAILSRHCPIYNSFLESSNEINLYCFYHIVAFLLKVDFRSIYDRYKRYSEKKERHKVWTRNGVYALVLLAIFFLFYSVYTQRQLINKQSLIVDLEKVVFPYSVVTGYVDNFMLPIISYVKKHEPDAHIYVHMPTDSADLDNHHKDRYEIISSYIEKNLELDSIEKVHLKTSMPRGSMIHKLYSSSNEALNHSYIDFASTTSTFLAIAQKKKEYPVYQEKNVDEIIEEYTDIFITQAKEQLGSDSVYVTFVKKISDISKAMKQNN